MLLKIIWLLNWTFLQMSYHLIMLVFPLQPKRYMCSNDGKDDNSSQMLVGKILLVKWQVTTSPECLDWNANILGPYLLAVKKIISMVISVCIPFHWTRSNNSSRKDLVAWDNICKAKIARDWMLLTSTIGTDLQSISYYGSWNKTKTSYGSCGIDLLFVCPYSINMWDRLLNVINWDHEISFLTHKTSNNREICHIPSHHN